MVTDSPSDEPVDDEVRDGWISQVRRKRHRLIERRRLDGCQHDWGLWPLGGGAGWSRGRRGCRSVSRGSRPATIDAWRDQARERLRACLLQPDSGGVPKAQVQHQLVHDGLHIEHLSWQLPYGPPTEAVFLKPAGAQGRLPAVLGLHDHGGNKYFGWRKIAQIGDQIHPMMKQHRDEYYGGLSWANELARRGFAVLVHDAFAFASRRVRVGDLAAGRSQGPEGGQPRVRGGDQGLQPLRRRPRAPDVQEPASAPARPGRASSRPKTSARSITSARATTSIRPASAARASPAAACAPSTWPGSTTASAAPAASA